MSEWKECKLGEICDVRDGTHDSPKQSPTGFPLITSKNLKSGCIDLENTYLISESDFWDINKRSKVDKFDILYSMIGTVGEIAIVKSEPSFAIKNVGLFKCKGNYELAKWVYYFMQSSEAKEELQAAQKGSTQSYISLGDLRSFPILLPPLPEQRAIAAVLSSLDDKIDLLHRQNKTLEAMAETLFRQWFVEEADEGWEEVPLKEICVIFNGYAFQSPTYTESGQKIIRTLNFKNHWIELNGLVYISEEFAREFDRFFLRRNDFLLVMVGASLGNFAIVTQDILPALQNQNMWRFRAIAGFSQHYLNYGLRRIIDETLHGASGSAREFFQKGVFYELKIPSPPQELLDKFETEVKSLFSRIELNRYQIRTLESLRDTLLPKLMSGEVRVKV